MADSKSDVDANEPATQHKLDKARERGSIPRSIEVNFAAVMLACLASVLGLGVQILHQLALQLRQGLMLADVAVSSPSIILALVQSLSGHMLMVIAPFIFSIWVTAVLIGGLQAQGVFTAEPLKTDFTRLNPAQGLKRVLSMKSLHDLQRCVAKLLLLTLVACVWGQHHLGQLLALSFRHPRILVVDLMAMVGGALASCTGVIVLLALVDLIFSRWDFRRTMRMSKKEVKDEHKEREGDPRIKVRLRELRTAWIKRSQQLSQVRDADVLLTNPTHVAVALSYRQGEMQAPKVTASGAGEFALRMRKEAQRHGVPIVEHRPLARVLHASVEVGALVPHEQFEAVARVLRWVYAARPSVRKESK